MKKEAEEEVNKKEAEEEVKKKAGGESREEEGV